jgi:hypothetical protein
MDQYDIVIVQMMAMIASNTNEMFNSHEMERRRGGGVNLWIQLLVFGIFGYYANHIGII